MSTPTDKSYAAQGRMHAVDERFDDGSGPELGTPLDLLLSEAGTSPLRRFLPGMSGVRFSLGLARRPGRVVGRAAALGAELARVGVGRSELEAAPKDRRFTDDAWTKNPFLKRTLQGYLAWGESVRGLVGDAELGWGDEQRMGFILDNLVEASSPSNNPFLNPKVLKRIVDTGGGNLVVGSRRLVRDFASAPRVPSMVEPDAFEVGTDLAVTPGAVVFRTDVFELIQYTPRTGKVREVPLLIVPPTINKYYVIDLAEHRSLVEHLVASGQQVYCISWRNPDVRHAEWGVDTYGQAIIEAMTVAQEISRRDQVALFGICSGGMLASMVLAHLAATGDLDRVAAFSLAVTVLDQHHAGLPSALLSHKAAAASTAASREKGYLDGKMLAEVFAWLRPNDLIWNYWVNNYLMGHAPKAFDILFWNADSVRMTAAMHRDFMDLALRNALVEPGASRMLGSDLDLSKVDVDSYVVAGIADHLCKWESCYRTTQLMGGDARFILSTSGHIAAMVNPPGNPKASFQTGPENPPTAAAWLDQAEKVQGSWWTTTPPGWPSGPGPSATGRASWAPRRTRLSARLRGPTSMTAETSTPLSAPDTVRTVTVRGITARVSERRGVGRFTDRPPLLLCNGIGVSFEALQPFVDALDPERGVVRFDVPGVGGSPLPPFPYAIAGLASWVTAMMSEMGHRRFDVLGLSWGGGLAQQLAVQSRRRVRRVVLAATATGCLMVPAHPRVLAKMMTPRRHRDPAYAASIASEIYGGTMRTDPARGSALLHAATRSGLKRGYYYQLLAMAGWSSLPFLGLLRQPTLVLAGKDDPIIPLRQRHGDGSAAARGPPAPVPRWPSRHRHRGRRARAGRRRLPGRGAPAMPTEDLAGLTLDDSPASDFLGFELLLGDEDRELLSRVRAFMSREVEPVINDHWTRASFPHELVPGLAGLGIAGLAYDGPGCPDRARSSTAWWRWSCPGWTPPSARSWACTAVWPWARSSSAAPTSSGSGGCPRWPGWS